MEVEERRSSLSHSRERKDRKLSYRKRSRSRHSRRRYRRSSSESSTDRNASKYHRKRRYSSSDSDSNKDKRDRRRHRSSRTRSRSNSRRYRPHRSRSRDKSRDRQYRDSRRRYRRRSPSLSEKEAQNSPKSPIRKEPKDIRAHESLKETRAGGMYIPPARMRMLQQSITDKSSIEFQKLSWEALKKSINGPINKVNTSNLKDIAMELFSVNLIRGKGLFCRSIMKAQAASIPFTPVYAALTAVINTKFPQLGELLLTRLIVQFRRAYRRNDKIICLANTAFIAHLTNQRVTHEIVALQILALLLERPTDDSVEVAVGFMKEVGSYLAEVSPKANNAFYDRFRDILHQGEIDKRAQYQIEVLFQIRKDKYKDNPIIPEGLDVVEEDDQITHYLSLDDQLDPLEGLGLFQHDPEFLENEAKYQDIKKEIIGDSDDEDADVDSDEESDEDEEEEIAHNTSQLAIHDQTNTDLVNLRRTIYLTIMSSIQFEETVHKLMKLNIQPGEEIELCRMIIECCSQEKTYAPYYSLMSERLCKLNMVWAENFEKSFIEVYETVHRYETNRIRNIAKFFGHQFSTDALPFACFAIVKLTEEDTNPSSRIFLKILFQNLLENFGIPKLKERFFDPFLAEAFAGLFPKDNPKNTRFAINYFTSINLGFLTDDLRETLKKAIAATKDDPASPSSSSSSVSSEYDSDSYDSSSTGSRSTISYRKSPHSPRRR